MLASMVDLDYSVISVSSEANRAIISTDVGVEQEAHQMLTSSGGSSKTNGISCPPIMLHRTRVDAAESGPHYHLRRFAALFAGSRHLPSPPPSLPKAAGLSGHQIGRAMC
jgi:hypothetical protein